MKESVKDVLSRGLLLIAVPLALGPGRSAEASYLTINGAPTLNVSMDGENISLSGSFEITNRGDEEAADVFPGLSLGQWSWVGSPKRLPAGKSEIWEISARIAADGLGCRGGEVCGGADLPGLGKFPLLVRRHYSDLNGYQFSAADVASVIIGEMQPQSKVALQTPVVDAVYLCDGDGRDFQCELSVRNSGTLARKVEVSYYTAKELEVLSRPTLLPVGPNETARTSSRLRNFRGLPGSTYAVFAILQWEETGVRNFISASALMPIAKPSHLKKFVMAGAAAGIILAALLYVLLARRPYQPRAPNPD